MAATFEGSLRGRWSNDDDFRPAHDALPPRTGFQLHDYGCYLLDYTRSIRCSLTHRGPLQLRADRWSSSFSGHLPVAAEARAISKGAVILETPRAL